MTIYAATAAALVLTLVVGSTRCAEKVATNPPEYFSAGYSEAREKFLSAADKAGAVIQSHKNGREGPRGEPLFTDVAILGPSHASSIVIILSGTHGVEGFCGSGLQTGLLRNGIGTRLPKGVRVVLVHAINPYGMAWLRRVNENNVDVNRNFIANFRNPPQNTDYVRLADDIAPQEFSDLEKARKRLLAFASEAAQTELRKLGVKEPSEALRTYVAKLGELRLRTAIHRGQYTHPEGLQFGGSTWTWSNKTFQKIVKQHVIVGARLGTGQDQRQESKDGAPRGWGVAVDSTVP